MNGKKFVVLFLGLIVISSVAAVVWMKQGYDTRPNVKIEAPVGPSAAPQPATETPSK